MGNNRSQARVPAPRIVSPLKWLGEFKGGEKMKIFKRNLVWAIGVLFFSAQAFAQMTIFEKPLSPRIANYDIDVRLEPKQRLVSGKETLTWFNKTSEPVSELQFHLYQNAFRNNKSTFMKESRTRMKQEPLKDSELGFCEVKRLWLGSGEDLSGKSEFIHPDDDNAEDKTVMRVLLPKPVQPGESIVVHIEFMTKLPEPPIARSGAKGDYFFVSQWFPKIGVFETGKWNCHQYHSHTEFYADFGVYDVKMTVPEKNIVGATGLEVSKTKNNDGTMTHFYHAEDVHDFAWTTSPDFLEFTGEQNGVKIRALVQKSHRAQGKRHIDAAKLAIEYFEKWYGDYPFPNLTVVDPAKGASETSGMEYPTLITAGTITGLPRGVRSLEMVIIHEFGHNFWYHIIASNEFEDSWLDEGINTYSEIQIMHDIFGAEGSMVDFLGLKVDDLQMRRYGYVRTPDADPIVKNAWEYYSGASYGAMSYDKPAMMLITLENYLGRETMLKIMRAYFERWRFKHPKTRDFVAVANEIAGQNLDWFFNQALYTNAILDYAVDKASTRELPDGQGYDFTASVSETDELEKKKPEPGKGLKDEKEKMYISEVWVRRLGDFIFPVEVEMEFENGEKIREKWDGKDLWVKYKYLKPVKLVKAVVDPDKKIPLDLNWKNNTKTVKQQMKDEAKKGGYVQMLKFALNPQ